MGAFLDKPKTEKHNESGIGNGLKYGLSSMQGWRVEMEDAHTADANLEGDLKDWAFFAVFDGHAGATVSAHCSQHLLPAILSEDDFKEICKGTGEISEQVMESIKKGIRCGFLKLDETMRQIPLVASGDDRSGTTAVCALISPTHIFLANCGDSRAVLYRSSGVCVSTTDHKPVNPSEKERIQNAGGSVMIQRVNGSLAVSRALGDFEYKNVQGLGPCEQLVSPEPEIYIEKRTDIDEFLILACDGIWDVMTNEELCSYVRSRLLLTDNIETISNWVIDTCFYKGSRDNMSIVIIVFPGAPSVSPEAIEKEKELEDLIEKRVTELYNDESAKHVSQIMRMLTQENYENVPPGAGIIAKRGFVESLLPQLKTDDDVEASADPDCDEFGNIKFLPSSNMLDRLASMFQRSEDSE